ncbi:Crp/Fnr family transcriptional regulator [Candidatus Saccharibacteria bacterium]|nr:Crp/Fnr family transcriptional regulator [Candidatus Saccharibacteria bacterium]MCA9328426.1 Crp/Fnr family transcriptional regulator [Candidatus Saccharibacteria bacterium]
MTQVRKWELLDSFFKAHTRIQYKKGETIIRPEDEPNGVYLIEWGFVKAYTITKYGEENLLLVRGTGSVFPLIWAFTGEHRSVTYEAMESTSLWRVSKVEYLEFLDRNPDIIPVILDMAIDAYRLHSERVMTLSYRTARERVISFLLTNVKRFGILNKDGSQTIHAPYRQSDIASSVNATRETTSREINSLKKRKIISVVDHKIVVHDVDALAALL